MSSARTAKRHRTRLSYQGAGTCRGKTCTARCSPAARGRSAGIRCLPAVSCSAAFPWGVRCRPLLARDAWSAPRYSPKHHSCGRSAPAHEQWYRNTCRCSRAFLLSVAATRTARARTASEDHRRSRGGANSAAQRKSFRAWTQSAKCSSDVQEKEPYAAHRAILGARAVRAANWAIDRAGGPAPICPEVKDIIRSKTGIPNILDPESEGVR